MSAVDPRKQQLLAELNSRRASLTPDKVRLLDELNSRWGVRKPSRPDRGADTQKYLTPGEVATGQARELILGGVEGLGMDPARPIGSAIEGVWNFAKNAFTNPLDTAKEVIAAPVTVPIAIGTQIREGLETGDWQGTARGVGNAIATVGSAAAGTGRGRAMVDRAITKVGGPGARAIRNTPERLMSGAATLRKAADGTPDPGIPFTQTGAIVSTARTAAGPGMRGTARVMEGTARQLSKLDPTRPNVATRPVVDTSPTVPTDIVPVPEPHPFVGELRPRSGPSQPIIMRDAPIMEDAPLFTGELKPPAGPRQDIAMPDIPEIVEPDPFAGNLRVPAGPRQDIVMRDLPDPSRIAPRLSMSAPQLNKWMNVSPRDMAHGSNPGRQVLRDRLLGSDKASTLANVESALEQAGTQIQAILHKADQTGIRFDNDTPITAALDDAIKTIGKRTDAGFQAALSNILDDILAKHPDLTRMSPADTHQLKVDLGDAIQWGRGVAYEADLNRVLISMYRKLNQNLKTGIPGVDEAQSRWGNLYQAAKSLKSSIIRDEAGRGAVVRQPTGIGSRVQESLRNIPAP